MFLLRVRSFYSPLSLLLLSGLVATSLSAQQPKVLTPHRPLGKRIEKRLPWGKPMERQSATGGLWMIDTNRKATLNLTNGLKADPITVTPILYLSNGQRYPLSAITLEASGTAIVDIGQALDKEGVAPFATLYGYAEIEYQWPWAAVSATIKNVDVLNSLIFIFGLQPSPDWHLEQKQWRLEHKGSVPETLPASFEGLWWKQEKDVSAFLGLSNVTGRPIHATVRLTGKSDVPLASYDVTISPQGTKMLTLEELKTSTSDTGGIYVTHDGPEGGLDINGGLLDEAVGFSASLPLRAQPSPSQPQLPQVLGLSELGLMSGAADPMMNFPSGTVFTPYSLVRNISDQTAEITPELWWMANGSPQSATLPKMTIVAHQTVNLNVPDLLGGAGLKNFSGSVNLILNAKTDGGLVFSSGSVDQKNTYVFEVVAHGIAEGAAKEICYWSTGNGDDTMVTLWNAADEPQDLGFTLFFSGGQYIYPIHLGPRETRTLNVSEILHSSIPDAAGNIIPGGISEGSAEIAGALAEDQHILISLDVAVYNVRKATCGTVCWECDGVVSASIALKPFGVAVSGTTQETFYETWNTGSQQSPSASWSSSNTSIATVNSSSGVVTGVRTGSITLTARDPFTATAGVGWYCTTVNFFCPTQSFQGSGSGTSASLSCSPSSITRGGSTSCNVSGTPSGATFSNWKFTDSSNNVVNGTGSSSSWSGTMVTGGTVSVSVTVGSTTFPLTASVSVTKRNWHTNAASATNVPNGTFIVLPQPPQNVGSDAGLGFSKWWIAYNGFSGTTISSGPNTGYYYYANNLTYSTFYYQYEINPDLQGTGSAFYQAQCGNYNATSKPNGFISGSSLLTQTNRHEWSGSTQSHYAFYSTGLSSNNLGDYAEARVAPPGTSTSTFDTDTGNGLTADITAVNSAASVEPYAVNLSETGAFLGNVNYSPYVSCQ